MAKLSGLGILGVTLTDADGGGAHNITNDIEDFTTTTSLSTYDVTGIDKVTAHERLGGVQDQKVDLTVAFNNANFSAHRLCSRGLAVARTLVLVLAPGAPSGSTQTATYLINSYGVTRSNTGALQGKVSLVSQSGTVAYT